ncbi:putative ribonuclease H-like domain-containing protein [Tanacetum coccineum]|uniref:Ribonuclease H-like domain-containing protein n=1 Tax=Tanacetum coccineum TaxID=301880 RepID=A0ABQ4ZI66_9ASTR
MAILPYESATKGFKDPEFPNKVYKVEKALYGLHQAPRAWYKTLSTYLLENGFRRGTIDKTLFIKKDKDDAQEIPDEFYGGAHFLLRVAASTPMETNKSLLKDKEAADVDVHLYRLMIGSLMYLTASRPDIMFVVCACARDSPFDLEFFSNSDYAGASLYSKSTTGGCQFLGRRLISWQCKKKTIVANSTTEAEYVAAVNCCGQVLWIQNQLLDYGYNFMNTKIFIDNESTICIVKNLVFHSKTKHIEIRHHFIRDSYEKGLIQVIKIYTDHNVADLLTKAFDVSIFQYLIARCLEWNGTAAKDEIQVSTVRVTYYYETVIKEWEDRMERAATTASSLEVEHDSGNINRTQSMATLNESLPQGTGSGSGPSLGTSKAKTVNRDRQIQALVDKKKVIITEKSVRSDLMLEDVKGTEFLPNDLGMNLVALWHLLSSVLLQTKNLTFPMFLDKQVEGMSKHKWIYVTPSYTKKIFANMKREGKGFSGRITPLFQTIMVQAPEDMGEDSAAPTDSYFTPIITQPSSFKSQKKKSRRKQRKDSGPTEPIPDEATNKEPISTPSYDPP